VRTLPTAGTEVARTGEAELMLAETDRESDLEKFQECELT
jgi:hypothetical protein